MRKLSKISLAVSLALTSGLVFADARVEVSNEEGIGENSIHLPYSNVTSDQLITSTPEVLLVQKDDRVSAWGNLSIRVPGMLADGVFGDGDSTWVTDGSTGEPCTIEVGGVTYVSWDWEAWTNRFDQREDGTYQVRGTIYCRAAEAVWVEPLNCEPAPTPGVDTPVPSTPGVDTWVPQDPYVPPTRPVHPVDSTPKPTPPAPPVDGPATTPPTVDGPATAPPTVDGPATAPPTVDGPATTPPGNPGNGKGNNGHGNNDDGVDVSNPGHGHGGPNGQDDPSGSHDDEGKGNGNNGQKGNGKGNNGHGNNDDGVDVSNPGKGHGGPNGQDDQSVNYDDEGKNNGNNGQKGNGK